MTTVIPASTSLSEAWARTLGAVQDAGGTALHVVTTVTDPTKWGTLDHQVVQKFHRDAQSSAKPIETVASTIFPQDLYRWQGRLWHPELPEDERQEIDAAAQELFTDYQEMLPLIASDPSNTWQSTYFGRMVEWPKSKPPTNQLQWCIGYLRTQLRTGKGRANSADIATGGEGELGSIQIHKSDERRIVGGPCLVHVDFSVHKDRLSLLATYRHWHLVDRALGNLLGLSRLLRFMSEQSGYPVGELTVISGMANAQRDGFGGKRGIDGLLQATIEASGGWR